MKTTTILLLLGACTASDRYRPQPFGDPVAGKATIEHYGCNACHAIPEIRGFGGEVAPSLAHIANRALIAGELPNTPANLVRWIQDPHAIEEHTAMPTLGLTPKEARDVAAYLYTLD
jgi:cytochrome c1